MNNTAGAASQTNNTDQTRAAVRAGAQRAGLTSHVSETGLQSALQQVLGQQRIAPAHNVLSFVGKLSFTPQAGWQALHIPALPGEEDAI